MSKAMQLVGIILLGIFTLVIIYLMSDVRSTNELDYYLLQEVTEASMYDAVDYSYYRESGLLKVDRDMFLESFNRRFAESVTANRDYEIKIIDFNETPPKVSIEVTAPTIASIQGEVALVTNRVSGIIETIYDDYLYSRGLYGTTNVDQSAPTISFIDNGNNNYSILAVDDYLLYGYKIIKTTDNDRHSSSAICNSVVKWDDPGAWVSSYAFNMDLDVTSGGYWIVAIDASNNCSAKQLSDTAPWIKSLNYAQAPSNTELIATVADDHGLSKYYIAPNGWSTSDVVSKCGSNSNICKEFSITGRATTESDGSVIYTSSIKLKLSEQGIDYGNYRLFVVDNKNHITKSNQDLVFRQAHKPSIEYAYDATSNESGTLTLTFKDTGNDLYGYRYSTSNNTPVNDTDYTKWSSDKTLTINNVKGGTYYVWAKDYQNDITKITLNIDVKAITTTPTCASGGSLRENNTKCYYSSNASQCGTEGRDWDDCLTVTNTCQPGYRDETYPGTCSGSGGSNTSVDCPTNLICPNKENCNITGKTQGTCDSNGNCQLTCHYSYSCTKTRKVWDKCLTVTNTCQGGYRTQVAKSCTKDATIDYTCPADYTNSNDKACIKLSAS